MTAAVTEKPVQAPKAIARMEGLGSKELVEAMKAGNWDVIAGAFFDEQVREAVQIAFDELDGAQGLVAWAKKNQRNRTAFYNIAAKLIPHQVTGAGGEPLIPPSSRDGPIMAVFLQSPTTFERPEQPLRR